MESVDRLVPDGPNAATLQDELIERNRELAVLNAIARSISHRHELQAILQLCLSEIRSLVPFELAGVALLDEDDTDRLTLSAVTGHSNESWQGVVLDINGTPLACSISSGKTVFIPDLGASCDQFSQQMLKHSLRSCVIVPLPDDERSIGAFVVADVNTGTYSPRHMSILEGIADHLAVAVSNAKLYESLHRRTVELEVMVRETHHRIQNNLQMIAGLVGMIGASPSDVSRGINKCLRQIKAISVINEILSCEHEFDTMDLKDTVERIACMSALAAAGGKDVSVEVTGDNICLPSKQASAVGIAVNELVTNAIEHGLTDRDRGHIYIHISSSERATEILVQDDGIGLPPGFSMDKTRSSGLGVLNLLLSQGIGGSLQLESHTGTVARISFRR